MLPGIWTVTWADFLLADVLTSLSAPMAQTGRAVCHMVTGPVLAPKLTEQARARALCRTPRRFVIVHARRSQAHHASPTA